MLATLLPLHEMMERAGPTTLKEVAFVQAYGRELAEAHEWCQKYRQSRKEAELHQVRVRVCVGWRRVCVCVCFRRKALTLSPTLSSHLHP